jgi:L-lysine exporter family protein LysE/ArgO
MFIAFLTGSLLGISLILVIGAQNAFVLRQGILRQHIFYVVLFCSISDVLLICIGITGISFFFNNFISEYSNLLFGLSSIWLIIYGFVRLKSAFKSNLIFTVDKLEPKSLLQTLSVLSVLTFANPHVYLDTVVLIGSVSQQFTSNLKIAFAIGASLSSFIFFFSLGYGAKIFAPLMQKPLSWKFLDLLIAVTMFTIAFKLALEGGWI